MGTIPRKAESEVLGLPAPSLQDHAVIPAVWKTLDARKSGFLRSTRGSIGVLFTYAPSAGALETRQAVVSVDPAYTLKVFGLVVGVWDALTDPVGDWPVLKVAAAGNGIYAPANFAAVLLRRQFQASPLFAADVAAQDRPVRATDAGALTIAEWDEGQRNGAILHQWTAAEFQNVQFRQPVIVNGGGDALVVAFDRVALLGESDAIGVWLDCAYAPKGADPF